MFFNITPIYRTYILLAFIAIAVSVVFQGWNDYILSLVLPVIDFILLLSFYKYGRFLSEKQFLFFTFTSSLIIRIVAVFIMEEILLHYNSIPFLSYKDDYIYNEAAIQIMDAWKLYGIGFYDSIRFSSDTYSGFPNFSAALMSLFGKYPIVPRIGNAILSSLTVTIGYIICRRYATRQRARLVGIILTIFPLTIIYSTLQLKDTLLLFFTTIGIYASINILQSHKKLFSALLLVFSFTGILFGRPAVIIPLFVALLIGISIKPKKRIIKIIVIIIVVFLFLYVLRYLDSVGFTSVDEHFEAKYNHLTEKSIDDTEANVKNFSIAKYLGAPLYLIFSFFLPPTLLVDIGGESINYFAWAVLQHYAFLLVLIPAIYNAFKMRDSYPIPFYLLLVHLLLRIGQANSVFTIFSPRQSLGTLYVMYLILPMYKPPKKGWQRLIVILSIAVLIVYNITRMISHGMI